MNREIEKKLQTLRKEVRDLLCNRLTYPKSILELLQERSLTPTEIKKGVDYIDKCIELTDDKFAEFILTLKKESG